jgi:hypothetical protein
MKILHRKRWPIETRYVEKNERVYCNPCGTRIWDGNTIHRQGNVRACVGCLVNAGVFR